LSQAELFTDKIGLDPGDYQEIINNGYKFKEIGIGMYCDPIILPLLSTESLEFISDGVQSTRTEKLLKILNYEPVYRYLNVCWIR